MGIVKLIELIDVLVVIKVTEVSSNCLIIKLKLIGLIRFSITGVVTFFVSQFTVIS